MRNFRNFFYRLDIIRYVCWGLIIPEFIIMVNTHFGFEHSYVFIPLFVVLLIGSILPFWAPKEDDIIKTINENHKSFLSQSVKLYEGKHEENATMLEGYAPIKSRLRRKVGTRAVYPICRTLVFIQDGDMLHLHIKDTPLMGSRLTNQTEFTATMDSKFHIECGKYDEKSKALNIKITVEDKKLNVLIGERYKLQDVIDKYSKFVITDN